MMHLFFLHDAKKFEPCLSCFILHPCKKRPKVSISMIKILVWNKILLLDAGEEWKEGFYQVEHSTELTKT